MSSIKIKVNNLHSTYLLKSADSIFLPKYYFVQDMNPSFELFSKNIVSKYGNFNSDEIFTSFCFYKHMEKLSLNLDKKTCWNSLQTKEKTDNKDKSEKDFTREIVNNIYSFYDHDKYSNVKLTLSNN